MSTIYHNEPPTSGKLLITTTIGDIEIDLWSKEAPKACRNFVQLCMSKYYNGVIFHRVIKGFIAQGGDPTGNGQGGESYDGEPFADEFHQRLRFIRRGLVAMANSGKPNDNRSQFFITLGPCSDLNNKHTIFGSVVNNTIYNVLKMEELEIGSNERPKIPPKILKTNVIENPFPDIKTTYHSLSQPKITTEKYTEAFKHIKLTQNKNLLSFCDDEDNEEISSSNKMKSCHDVLDDPTLSKQPVLDIKELASKKQSEEILKEKPVTVSDKLPEPEIIIEDEQEKQKRLLKEEQQELWKELKTTKRKVKLYKEEAANKNVISEKIATLDEEELLIGSLRKDFTINESVGEYILSNSKYLKRKKLLPILNKNDKREFLTLGMLRNFEKELSDIQTKAIIKEKERNDDTNTEIIETETDWMNHMLCFEKQSPYISNAFDANVEFADRYDITDPRNPINMRKSGIKPQKE